MKPDVSVIIPTFNRADCLPRAVESVERQSFSSWELIVVDDGSQDATEEVMRERFPWGRYLRLPKNRGVSHARNQGIDLARGNHLAFLDSDDAWLPDKLERQMRWMSKNPRYEVCYTDEIWIRNGVRVNPMNKHRKYSGEIYEHCLPLCLVSPSSVLMQASLFDKVGRFDEALEVCEDYDLWLRIALHRPIGFIEEALIVKYGGHADQLSRKYWGMDRSRVYTLEKLLNDPALKGLKRQKTLDMLEYKCDILTKGFEKRGKTEEADRYRKLPSIYKTPSMIKLGD